jgi:hypothetical protein
MSRGDVETGLYELTRETRASNWVIRSIPEFPATRLAHDSVTVLPTGLHAADQLPQHDDDSFFILEKTTRKETVVASGLMKR